MTEKKILNFRALKSFHYFFIQQTAISFSKFCVTKKVLDLFFHSGLGRCQDGSSITSLLGMSFWKKRESWEFLKLTQTILHFSCCRIGE